MRPNDELSIGVLSPNGDAVGWATVGSTKFLAILSVEDVGHGNQFADIGLQFDGQGFRHKAEILCIIDPISYFFIDGNGRPLCGWQSHACLLLGLE